MTDQPTIITDDAFKVSQELLAQHYETDKHLLRIAKAIEKRRQMIEKSKVWQANYRVRQIEYRQRQGIAIGALHNSIAKRKKEIRKIEKLKLIRRAAADFQRRVRKEGLTVK